MLKCPRAKHEHDNLTLAVCGEYAKLLKAHKKDMMLRDDELQSKIDNIWKVLPKNKEMETRQKRIPLLPIFSIVSGIAGWVN
jgi:hypothetical protein